MRGEIVTPTEFSLNEITSLPIKINDLVLLGGNIQLNYRYGETGVLHVSSTQKNLTSEQILVCNRWIYPQKGELIKNVYKAADHIHENICTPKILSTGTTEISKYPYWFESFEVGEKLSEKIFSPMDKSIYKDITKWLGRFHELVKYPITLREYYSVRLFAVLSILNTMDFRVNVPNSEFLISLTYRAMEKINTSIEETEPVVVIHGDLHGGNVVIGEKNITLLDFEQGVMGGDWFTDINKLLNPQSESIPDRNRAYRYIAPLMTTEKQHLLNMYVNERVQNGWNVPVFLKRYIDSGKPSEVEPRSDMCALDNSLSVLVLRYLSNWNYYTNESKRLRGTHYLSEYICNKFENY